MHTKQLLGLRNKDKTTLTKEGEEFGECYKSNAFLKICSLFKLGTIGFLET